MFQLLLSTYMNIMSEWALKREGEAENVRMESDGGRGADKAALTFGGGGGDWRGAGRKTATLDPPVSGSSV